MKHIFWVHSHITYLIATVIIEYNNLNDSTILLTRNYTLPFKTKATVFAFPYYFTPSKTKHRLISKINIISSMKSIKHCNKLIDQICKNKDFIFYAPLFNQPSIQCFIEHLNCRKFYYIEEGSASYRTLEYFQNNSIIEKMKCTYLKLLPYSNILGRNFYDDEHPKFFGTYSFFKDAFPWNDNEKYILPFNQIKKIDKIETDAFLFFDALVEFGHVSMDVFIKVLNDVIKFLILKEYKIVSFKFHPEQKKERNNKNKIISLFNQYSNSITFIELNSDFIAENYFMQYKSNVFVFLSSIGIYAKKSGSKVLSLMCFFEKHDKEFYNKYKSRVLV